MDGTQETQESSSGLHGLDVWAAALPASVEATAPGIGFAEGICAEIPRSDVRGPGVLMALVSDKERVQFEMFADEATLAKMARALMLMEDDEEELPWEDTVDAVCEVANIITGALKGVINDPAIRLGLPTFIDGVQHRSGDRQRVFSVRFDGLETHVALAWSAE